MYNIWSLVFVLFSGCPTSLVGHKHTRKLRMTLNLRSWVCSCELSLVHSRDQTPGVCAAGLVLYQSGSAPLAPSSWSAVIASCSSTPKMLVPKCSNAHRSTSPYLPPFSLAATGDQHSRQLLPGQRSDSTQWSLFFLRTWTTSLSTLQSHLRCYTWQKSHFISEWYPRKHSIFSSSVDGFRLYPVLGHCE